MIIAMLAIATSQRAVKFSFLEKNQVMKITNDSESNHESSTTIIDTSKWVGAEYAPMQSSNEDWLYHYEDYVSAIDRELALVKRVLGE